MGLLLLQVCLQGMLQVDDCEGTNHECWAEDANMQTACKDTFRGYICQCPPGVFGVIHWCLPHSGAVALRVLCRGSL